MYGYPKFPNQRAFPFFSLKRKDEESGSDSEFRPRRTSFEDKGKVAEKKQETVPETVSEKKGGVGFAVETSQENNKEAVEEVGPNIKISILFAFCHTFLLIVDLRIWCTCSYSGTPLIRSSTGDGNLTVLTG